MPRKRFQKTNIGNIYQTITVVAADQYVPQVQSSEVNTCVVKRLDETSEVVNVDVLRIDL